MMTWRVIKCLLACVALASLLATVAWGKSNSKNLPVLQNVGVIPVQWDAGAPNDSVKDNVEQAFFKSVHSAHRFRVLEDELIADMWEKPSQRNELVSQYQLHAFVSLSITQRGDVYNLNARCLSPQLETYLYESDTLSRAMLVNSTRKQLGDIFDTLIYRMFNRLPIDASVTSVQGEYVTFSAGANQGIQEADVLNVVHPSIATRHPINGSWLSFQKRKAGTVKIIEVKNYTSVGKIQDQTSDGSIEVGDGVKVASISGRSKFSRAEQKQEFVDNLKKGPIIVEPLYEEGPKMKAVPEDTKKYLPKAAGTPPKPAPKEAKKSAPEATSVAQEKVEPTTEAASETPSPEDADEKKEDENPIDIPEMLIGKSGLWASPTNYTVFAGPTLWRASGSADAAAGFPMFPLPFVHRVGVASQKPFIDRWTQEAAVALSYGKTGSGSFLGLDGKWGALYTEPAKFGSGSISQWHGGGNITGNFGRVFAESFGGMDMVRFTAVGGVGGKIAAGTPLEWKTDLDITPMYLGRIGTSGVTETAKFMGFGWMLDMDLMEQYRKGDPSFLLGGGLQYGSEGIKTKSGTLNYKTLNLLVSARKYL